ncbi:hypothetical protein [Kibdelosporangium phytohabitans]|uniref:hypothetical protein n=1 Tax=Kibdelosporangium phytohabitans TaxID=860235 RepID=UPI0012FC3131|nr:hypothetical protein [Kibdelosporangium phytohabitans]MBE1468226.1 hypothetical protein [Kibdelosporangium phytohabitans]
MLLLRAGKESSGTVRVDVAFINVEWMNIPVYMDGLIVEQSSLGEVNGLIDQEGGVLSGSQNIFMLRGMGYRGYLAAGSVEVDESDKGYNEVDSWGICSWVK